MNTAPRKESVANLLSSIGITGMFSMKQLKGGRNNRVYHIRSREGIFLLKSYFHHPEDQRDRAGTEFLFMKFVWDRGLRSIPRPLAYDHTEHFGLYEFIEGRHLKAGEPGEKEITLVSDFFLKINEHRDHPDAQNLLLASEACFSIGEHLKRIETRIRNLENIVASSRIHREARDFALTVMIQKWKDVSRRVQEEVLKTGFLMDEELVSKERRLSPSDFGFHNALRQDNGTLKFVDFEYAGWDDPAKTVCDFFCQPAVPAPISFFKRFAESLFSGSADPERAVKRAILLFPVYKMKWCSILLNDFQPVGESRRSFARKKISKGRYIEQLKKARSLIDSIDQDQDLS